MANCCDNIYEDRYKHDLVGVLAIMAEDGNTFKKNDLLKTVASGVIAEKNAEDICRIIKTCKEVKKFAPPGDKTTIAKWITNLEKACKGGSNNSGGNNRSTPTVIKGCTDEDYVEYNPNATEHRASDCKTKKVVKVYGCTDDLAWNYNANATDEDGSCEFTEEITLKYSYSFCNIAAGCDLAESSTKLVFDGGTTHDYLNETQLDDTDEKVLAFELKLVNELAENLEISGGFFPWGNQGWYAKPIKTDVKIDLAKALTLAIMSTFEYEFFPYKKVSVYNDETPIGEFRIVPGSTSSTPSKRIQELIPSNSSNITIARSEHNTILKKNVDITHLNKALVDRGITQFKVIQDGNNQVLVNVEISEPEDNKVVDNTNSNVNLEVESVIGLGSIIKQEPIGLITILK